jgi:predicted TIM-barrel fold metal-dependent hydrolase
MEYQNHIQGKIAETQAHVDRPMLIDWHTNLALPEHYGPGEDGEFAKRVNVQTPGTPESHRAHVADKVDQFVVVTMNFPRLKTFVPNEFVAEYVKQFPGRAKAMACVDPLAPDASKQLEFAIKELGMHGLKISPVYGGFDPNCREAGEIYKTCDRLGIPLLWHQSAGYAADCTLEYGNPIFLDRIGREFPKLRMIVAHFGQPWIGETAVLLRKHPQIFTDLSARYHRRWQLYHALMLAQEYLITKQILFGSDFPLRKTEDALREFRALNDWEDGVKLPIFPQETIEDIINNRPLELIWPNG